jgi:hypothetical protein
MASEASTGAAKAAVATRRSDGKERSFDMGRARDCLEGNPAFSSTASDKSCVGV